MNLFSKKRPVTQPKAQEKPLLQQDLSQKLDFSGVYMMRLLFDAPVTRPDPQTFLAALNGTFGDVEPVMENDKLSSYALRAHMVTYKDGAVMPSQLLLADVDPFDPGDIDILTRSQCWDVPDCGILLDSCGYELKFGDFLAGGLPYRERCAVLYEYAGLMLELFPSCVLMEFLPSGKLLTPQVWGRNPFSGELRFLHGGMNLRLFHIQEKEEQLADSLGLTAIGLPDIQCHFHTLEANEVVRKVCDVAAYLFSEGDIIENGQTVPGFQEEACCICQHEMSLIQPERAVLDLNAGRYAAGERGQG